MADPAVHTPQTLLSTTPTRAHTHTSTRTHACMCYPSRTPALRPFYPRCKPLFLAADVIAACSLCCCVRSSFVCFCVPCCTRAGYYDGSNLVEEFDVVVVSLQYRLGTFGYYPPTHLPTYPSTYLPIHDASTHTNAFMSERERD